MEMVDNVTFRIFLIKLINVVLVIVVVVFVVVFIVVNFVVLFLIIRYYMSRFIEMFDSLFDKYLISIGRLNFFLFLFWVKYIYIYIMYVSNIKVYVFLNEWNICWLIRKKYYYIWINFFEFVVKVFYIVYKR